jgi:CRISPR-associated protein Csb2
MLSLELELLTGRYVATSFDDRGRAEWPPHPARLFSALAAAHLDEAEPPPEERAALVWLEGLGPPEIAASEAAERLVVTHFVPVNDTTLVGSFEDLAAVLAEARAEFDAAKSKGTRAVSAAEKKVAKAQKRLDEAVAKATAAVEPGKESKEGPAKAASLLPERRVRQPRTFPSVAPADPRVVFSWPDAKPSPQQSAALDALAARVVRLGHSSSLIALRVASSEDSGGATWLPDLGEAGRAGGDVVLRVVEPGQLDALRAAFEQQGDAPGRVLPAAFQRYARPTAAPKVEPSSSVFGEDWIVLRRVAGPRLPSLRAVDVARTLRKALLEAAGPGVPEILSGHGPSGERSEIPHAAYVPLLYVGSQHADGAILGAAVVLPRDVKPGERLAVYRAFDEWERRRSQNSEEPVRLPLFLGRLGELSLVRLEHEVPQSLRPETWCHPSTSWASATPVALDRNPGDLRSKDPRKEAAAYAEAESTLATACEQIGLPRPQRVTVVPAAPLVGAEKARRFPPFATGKPPVQRVLVHAVIHFEAPVRGPILLGAGRYFGLGLFRPLRS